ncbi:HEAT repeat domain-containing protein [Paenibacillus kobensis]|uniref:HEAT repeat domain-containing protein n=1 Tax=Paenibacillus kobensis TaxID=59841 RepID=UPI0013E3FD23|nr:HEAT repeat domain-containing protein [Paenibacillus kobensis]
MITVAIEWVALIILLFTLLLIGITLYLFWSRTREKANQHVKKAYIEKHNRHWYEYFRNLAPFSEEMVPVSPYEIEAVEEIFLSYLMNVSDADIRGKIKQFANEHLVGHYKRMLSSRNWGKRMNSLYRIADFQIYALLDVCEQMERAKLSRDEYFQLLKIKLLFREERFIESFLFMPVKMSEFQYKQYMLLLSPSLLEQLKQRYTELVPECRYALIDTIGIRKEMDTLDFLKACLRDEDSEIRIRSLKAINELNIRIDLTEYDSFIASPVWEERFMMTLLLQRLPDEQSLPYLEKLMNDSSWYVREEAGRAISERRQRAGKRDAEPAY